MAHPVIAASRSISTARGNERRIFIAQVAFLRAGKGQRRYGMVEAASDLGRVRADHGTARCQWSWFRGQRRVLLGRFRTSDPPQADLKPRYCLSPPLEP